MVDIEKYLLLKKNTIEHYMKKLLVDYKSPSLKLSEAIEYSLTGSGKRFRPSLCIITGESLGCSEEKLLPPACAIEFIHNYSLIHDDLPCMDNDDYRRGRLTCHKKYDIPTALLAGDGLLTLAFEILSASLDFKPQVLLSVIGELACASGIKGMVGGQALDLLTTQSEISGLEKLHRMKTGDLIRSSVRIGALLSNASNEFLDALTGYAEHLGLAFQIVDDILDRDKNEINSFLSVYSYEDAKERVCKITDQAVECIEPLGTKGELLKEIAWYFCKRSY